MQNNKLSIDLKRLKNEGKKGLIIYLMAGYPNLETTEKLIYLLVEAGVDAIELGIPFSDAVADGPIIQKAGSESIKNGINIDEVFKLIERCRQKTDISIIIMSYYNPIYNYGEIEFLNNFKNVGGNGLIIPDLPFCESEELRIIAKQSMIELIPFITPTTKYNTLKSISNIDVGFVYCISVKGITGLRKDFKTNIEEMIYDAKKEIKIPLYLGFGISNEEHIKENYEYADGFIIGSAIIKLIQNNYSDIQLMADEVFNFIKKINSLL